MANDFTDVLSAAEATRKLKEPFEPDHIEWRIGRGGFTEKGPWATVLAYLTNRAIQDRLDEVFTPFGWRNEYRPGPDKGVICGISVLWDGEWITKWDGAENTEIEPVKGGLSDSMKRCAVQWGIGRYLYDLPDGFARIVGDDDKKALRGQIKDRAGKHVTIRWYPPQLPEWALPKARNGLEELPDRHEPQKTQEKQKSAARASKPPQERTAEPTAQGVTQAAEEAARKLQQGGAAKIPAGGEPASQAALTEFLRALVEANNARKDEEFGVVTTEVIASLARRIEWKAGSFRMKSMGDVAQLGEDRLRALTAAMVANPLKFETEFTG